MSLNNAKILIVDDESDLRELLAFEFQNLNAQVFEAENGNMAFDILTKNKDIDVVLTDIRMPNGNGIDLLRKTKLINSLKPIFVIVTAYSDVSRETIYDLGAESIFPKPFDLKELSNRIELLQNTDKWFTQKIESEYISEKMQLKENAQTKLNFARGGFNVKLTDQYYVVGSNIELEIELKNGLQIFGQGKVLWYEQTSENESYAGVEIRYLTPACLEKVASFLRTNSSVVAFVPSRPNK